jgi:hypothetical protein
MVRQLACQAWNKSHVRKHVRLVRAASSHYATKINIYTKGYNKKIINAHINMCSNRTNHLRIDMALIPLMGFVAQKTKISYDLQHTKIESRR